MCTHIVDTTGHSKPSEQPAMCGVSSTDDKYFSWNPRTSFEASPNKYYCDKCVEAYRAKYEKPLTKADMVAYVEERLTQFGSVQEVKLKPQVTKVANGVHIIAPGSGEEELCGAKTNYWNAFSTWESGLGGYIYCVECERIAKLMKEHAKASNAELKSLKAKMEALLK